MSKTPSTSSRWQRKQHALCALLALLCSPVGVAAQFTVEMHVKTPTGFLAALTDGTVSIITLDGNVRLDGSVPPSGPVKLKRSLTIRGGRVATTSINPYYLLDFNSTVSLITLTDGASLSFVNVELFGLYGIAEEYPLVFSGSDGGLLSITDSIDHRKLCLPMAAEESQLQTCLRPTNVAGTQVLESSTNEFCFLRDTEQLCFNQHIVIEDWACGPTKQANYTMHYLSVDQVCDYFLDVDCLAVPEDQYQACITEAASRLPPAGGFRPPLPTDITPGEVGSSWSLDLRVVILPVVLGFDTAFSLLTYYLSTPTAGSVVLGCVLLLGMWCLRRRQRLKQAADDLLVKGVLDSSALELADLEKGDSKSKASETFGTNSASATSSPLPTSHYSHNSGYISSGDVVGSKPGCNIQLNSLLGAGSFGRVYQGCWNAQLVAIKVIAHSAAAAQRVRREVELTMRFKHPNVLRSLHFEVFNSLSLGGGHDSHMLGTSQSVASMETWLVLEYCALGCLASRLNVRSESAPGPTPDCSSRPARCPVLGDMRAVLSTALDVARGMAYMHEQHICHGDLKCENVLIARLPLGQLHPNGSSIIAKVADFGLSRAMEEVSSHLSTATVGTVTHMPPELLLSGQLRPSCDVYSFGIMLWQLITGSAPYAGMRYAEIVYKVAVSNMRPVFPANVPAPYQHLATDCWQVDPAARPHFAQIVQRLEGLLLRADSLQAELERTMPRTPPDTGDVLIAAGSAEHLSPFNNVAVQLLVEEQYFAEAQQAGQHRDGAPPVALPPAVAPPAIEGATLDPLAHADEPVDKPAAGRTFAFTASAGIAADAGLSGWAAQAPMAGGRQTPAAAATTGAVAPTADTAALGTTAAAAPGSGQSADALLLQQAVACSSRQV